MRRPPASELLAWTLVGAAVGVVAGFVLGEVLGPNPVRGAGGFLPGKAGRKSRLHTARVIRAVRAALETDPALRELQLEPLAVGPGIVELHGWVPNRSDRSRAVRAVRAVTGVEQLVNRILVRGEDDDTAAATPFDAATDQPA